LHNQNLVSFQDLQPTRPKSSIESPESTDSSLDATQQRARNPHAAKHQATVRAQFDPLGHPAVLVCALLHLLHTPASPEVAVAQLVTSATHRCDCRIVIATYQVRYVCRWGYCGWGPPAATYRAKLRAFVRLVQLACMIVPFALASLFASTPSSPSLLGQTARCTPIQQQANRAGGESSGHTFFFVRPSRLHAGLGRSARRSPRELPREQSLCRHSTHLSISNIKRLPTILRNVATTRNR
jgi:hypothetical protein